MSWIEALILAIIQGITEPLPISSSGHLQLVEKLLGLANQSLTYEIYLNFGSLIGIVILYNKLLKQIFSGTYKYVKNKDEKYKNEFRYFALIFVASIPAAVVGFLFADKIEQNFTNAKVTGVMLVVTAIFLFVIRNFQGKKSITNVKVIDAILVGLCQVVALIPGISRSGATITGAMFANFTRKTAFDFSFLMFIPISIGAFLAKVGDVDSTSNYKYIAGAVMAGLLTYFTAKWFRSIVVNGKLIYMSAYCLIVGILAFGIL